MRTLTARPVLPMFAFASACLVATVLLTAATASTSGPRFAVPIGVVLAIEGLLAIGVYRIAGPFTPAVWYLQAAVYAMGIALGRARPLPPGWRAAVSWPAFWFLVGTFLALPWTVTGLTLGAAVPFVLAGHTHGGHVGLVSLGLDWTAVRALAGIPDHGAWGQRDNRLYVHRTNGHYGFPLRIGVPAEESVLELVWSAPPVSA